MNYLLDTNVVSKMVRGREQSYRLKAAQSLAVGNTHDTSVIVSFELEYGAMKGPQPETTWQKQASVLSQMSNIHNVTLEDAKIAARIRGELESRGEPIGEYDILIAAQAVRTGSVLVTNNRKHFNRINGLDVIDWSTN